VQAEPSHPPRGGWSPGPGSGAAAGEAEPQPADRQVGSSRDISVSMGTDPHRTPNHGSLGFKSEFVSWLKTSIAASHCCPASFGEL